MNKFNLDAISDKRGCLVSLEISTNIPFEIKRVYYLYNLNNEPRGFHAHKKLRQFLTCVSGSCTIKMDNGKSVLEFELNNPSEGIFIEPLEWHEMYNFSKDCVIMVLANDVYDEHDYIRNYEDFVAVVRSGN